MPTKKAAKYRVLNPNRIPAGIPVIGPWEHGGKTYQWYEGEELVPPDGMKLDRLLRDGFIVEVS